MAIGYGTSIKKEGLVYHVDFASPQFNVGVTITSPMTGLDSTYLNNNSKLVYSAANKTVTRNAVNDGTDLYRSNSPILLPSNFTMHTLVKLTDLHNGTANGILTNHSHSGNTGAGITSKHISDTDFRVSCNTGTGGSRTYHSFYGSTNIYNRWAFLTLRFTGSSFTLWVDDSIDYTNNSYAQLNANDYIDLFNWSTTYYTNGSYRPACSMSMAAVYNRALSDNEIRENFNSLRGRYEL
jgi:hypothetical protein